MEEDLRWECDRLGTRGRLGGSGGGALKAQGNGGAGMARMHVVGVVSGSF